MPNTVHKNIKTWPNSWQQVSDIFITSHSTCPVSLSLLFPRPRPPLPTPMCSMCAGPSASMPASASVHFSPVPVCAPMACQVSNLPAVAHGLPIFSSLPKTHPLTFLCLKPSLGHAGATLKISSQSFPTYKRTDRQRYKGTSLILIYLDWSFQRLVFLFRQTTALKKLTTKFTTCRQEQGRVQQYTLAHFATTYHPFCETDEFTMLCSK